MVKKILIVEDESVVALDLKFTLQKAGYEVSGIANSVEEAREILRKERPDMVLLDIVLKGNLNGLDLAENLFNNNIDFIYLSANLQDPVLELASYWRPAAILSKPFGKEELLVSLELAFFRQGTGTRLKDFPLVQEPLVSGITTGQGWAERLTDMSRNIQVHIPFDYLTIITKYQGEFPLNGVTFFRKSYSEYQAINIPNFLMLTGLPADELVKLQEQTPVDTKIEFIDLENDEEAMARHAIKTVIARTFGLRSYFGAPLVLPDGKIIRLSFYSRKANCYTPFHEEIFERIRQTLIPVFTSFINSPKSDI